MKPESHHLEDPYVIQLIETISMLDEWIEELISERREAFIAGYFKFASQVNLMNSNEEIQEQCDIAYKEWRDATKTTD